MSQKCINSNYWNPEEIGLGKYSRWALDGLCTESGDPDEEAIFTFLCVIGLIGSICELLRTESGDYPKELMPSTLNPDLAIENSDDRRKSGFMYMATVSSGKPIIIWDIFPDSKYLWRDETENKKMFFAPQFRSRLLAHDCSRWANNLSSQGFSTTLWMIGEWAVRSNRNLLFVGGDNPYTAMDDGSYYDLQNWEYSDWDLDQLKKSFPEYVSKLEGGLALIAYISSKRIGSYKNPIILEDINLEI